MAPMMVVGSHGLDDAVVPLEFPSEGLAESAECGGEIGTPFRAPAARAPKGNVRSSKP